MSAERIEALIRNNRLLELPIPWHDEIIYPHYGGFSIYNLSHSILSLLGAEADHPLDSMVWQGDVPQAGRVVFFLSDGLGYLLLNELCAEDAELADIVDELTDGRGIVPLTSVAPSTTAVALPTLWSATPPAVHGMLGSMMFLREAATMSDMLKYSPAIGDAIAGFFDSMGLKHSEFVPVQSMAQRLPVETHVVLERKLLHTGLSKILHRGAQHTHVHVGGGHVWQVLGETLEATAGKPCYSSIYWPAVDSLSHGYGANSPEVREEIKYQFRMLRDVLSKAQDGQTLFMMAADHGHHDAPHKLVDFGHHASRMPFGGDTRFAQFYLRGAYRQRLIDEISREHLDELVWIEPETAVHAGLFGPGEPHPELMYRLGDLIIVSRLGVRLADSHRPGNEISVHSGLSEREMLVPFIWKTL